MSLPVPSEQTHLTHPKYRADIDGLRAIAVLSVIGFHAFPTLYKGGFVGVDIFFVISGFLISSIIISNLEKGTFSFMEFYARRIKRIFPALILVMAACFAFGWFTLLTDEYKQLGKHIAGGAGFISNFLLWNESGYFDKVAETKPLLHLWSLGVEEQFYVIWPLLLWLAWKRRLNLLLIAIAIGVISFALNVYQVLNGMQSVAAFFSPQTRFWELMLGSVLAYTTLHQQSTFPKPKHSFEKIFGKVIFTQEANSKTLHDVLSWFGAILIVTGILIIAKDRHFPGWWALLPTLGTLLIITAGAHAWLNRVVLSNRILVWFGLISFPLYLWHWPLLSFARILEGETPSPEIRIASVLISIALAWLTYGFIEKPIRFGKYSQAKTVTLLFLMVVVGYAGYNSYERDGLGFRVYRLGLRLPNIFQSLTWTDKENQDLAKQWGVGSCFLNPDQDFSGFNACESQTKEKNKPSLILWGDSYAAALYPGYKASFGKTYRIIQRTSANCPPFLNTDIEDRPPCREINDHIFELIKKENPKKVVLAANRSIDDWKKVEETIIQLHRIGIKSIDLIGPFPEWNDSLYKQLFLKYVSDKNPELPYRMRFGLKQDFIQLDPLLYELSARLGVNYLSPEKILCNESGCITRFGETAETLTAYDGAHLTPMASRYVVSKFQND